MILTNFTAASHKLKISPEAHYIRKLVQNDIISLSDHSTEVLHKRIYPLLAELVENHRYHEKNLKTNKLMLTEDKNRGKLNNPKDADSFLSTCEYGL